MPLSLIKEILDSGWITYIRNFSLKRWADNLTINDRTKSLEPVLKEGLAKFSLIDLEARWGDRAEGESHRERLSERTPRGDAIV